MNVLLTEGVRESELPVVDADVGRNHLRRIVGLDSRNGCNTDKRCNEANFNRRNRFLSRAEKIFELAHVNLQKGLPA